MQHYEPDVAEPKNPHTTVQAAGPPEAVAGQLDEAHSPAGRRLGGVLLALGTVGTMVLVGYAAAAERDRLLPFAVAPLLVAGLGLALRLERPSARDPVRVDAVRQTLSVLGPEATEVACHADLGFYSALFPSPLLAEAGQTRERARWGVVTATLRDGRQMSIAYRADCRRSVDVIHISRPQAGGRRGQSLEKHFSDRIQDHLEIRIDGPLREEAEHRLSAAGSAHFRISRAEWVDGGLWVEFSGDPWARRSVGGLSWEVTEDFGRLDGTRAAAAVRAALEARA